ncbi:MAG TPA: fibronectin type III domain-containing protein [Gaiellaceae bacterium]|nr:fibronectin type III domain-containing protein [Gaiellaceae bacterium]
MRAKLVAGVVLGGLVFGGLSGPAGHAALASGCRPLRAVFYTATGSLAFAQSLASNASPCAQYYVSVPPLSADKTQMRSGVAGPIRALGSNFHALAEVNDTAWAGWVASNGGSWYQAGIEARTRMAAAGFDVDTGDSWAVDEFSSAVRAGTGSARQNARNFVHGLYDGGGQPAQGVVFVEGISQPTVSLGLYKANLESWLQDAGFWTDMSSYVSDFMQENYGDARDYGVSGADVQTRLPYLNAYLEHEEVLGSVSPSTGAAAAAYLQASYGALANAAWAWSGSFGYTAIPYDQMEDYVSAQVDAMRSFDSSLGLSGDRIGFAWDPSNSLGLSSSDFSSESAAIASRLGAAIAASADPAAPGAGACSPTWCTATVDGASFTNAWSTFSAWTPTSPAFGSPPQTVAAGSPTAAMTVQTAIGGIVTALPLDTPVTLSSSSAGGSFSASPSGPWTPTLQVVIPAGSTSAPFYMLDTTPGMPTVTASAGSTTAVQVEVVTAPTAPLTLAGGGNTVTYALGGGPVTVDAGIAPADSDSATLSSASVAITDGLSAGDSLATTVGGTGISASYANGTLSLDGTATVSDYQAALDQVSFSGTTSSGGSRTIVWTVGDGSATASTVSTILYTAAPGPPEGVSANAGNGQATVSFTAPASNGGTPISSYVVTASPGGQTATVSGSVGQAVVTGLANGTTYTFTVTAENAAGTGPASAPSNPVTPTAGGGVTSYGGSGGGVSAAGVTGSGGSAGGLSGAGAASGTVPPPLTPSAPRRTVALTISVTHLRAVVHRKRREIGLAVHLSRPATVTFTLRLPGGRTLETVRRTFQRGVHGVLLAVPARALHARRLTLHLTWPGHTRSLSVVLGK